MEYSDIKEQKMGQLKAQLAKQQEQQRKQEEAEMQLDAALRTVLTTEAKTRLANVKLVNNELYLKAAQAVLYLYRSGKIQGTINDGQIKELLKKLTEKKEIKIRRK